MVQTLAQAYTNAIKAEKQAYQNLLAAANTVTDAEYRRLSDALAAAIAANDTAFDAWTHPNK